MVLVAVGRGDERKLPAGLNEVDEEEGVSSKDLGIWDFVVVFLC